MKDEDKRGTYAWHLKTIRITQDAIKKAYPKGDPYDRSVVRFDVNQRMDGTQKERN